jgi:hypothetical protein
LPACQARQPAHAAAARLAGRGSVFQH